MTTYVVRVDGDEGREGDFRDIITRKLANSRANGITGTLRVIVPHTIGSIVLKNPVVLSDHNRIDLQMGSTPIVGGQFVIRHCQDIAIRDPILGAGVGRTEAQLGQDITLGGWRSLHLDDCRRVQVVGGQIGFSSDDNLSMLNCTSLYFNGVSFSGGFMKGDNGQTLTKNVIGVIHPGKAILTSPRQAHGTFENCRFSPGPNQFCIRNPLLSGGRWYFRWCSMKGVTQPGQLQGCTTVFEDCQFEGTPQGGAFLTGDRAPTTINCTVTGGTLWKGSV